MEVIVRIDDYEKALKFMEFLTTLDFVKGIKTFDNSHPKAVEQTSDTEIWDNFFSLAGLWENRNINIENLRKQAWRDVSI
ncbi:MAG: hypothetical protein HQK63_07415 [Desulfamplus sp.]|nr:hypothetical protein [Desulfamplus sp.]